MVVAKAAVNSAFLAAVVTVGALLTWALTYFIFGTAPGSALWGATATFVVLGLVFVALMTALSVAIRSGAGAAGAGLGVYVLLAIAPTWQPLGKYSLAGLTTDPGALAAGNEVSDLLWPIVTAVTAALLLVALACRLFRRQDL